jgi:cysteinyl-tRNA synthetase
LASDFEFRVSDFSTMPIRVYSTLTRQKEEFQTVEPGKVKMYLCGPTVYKPAHIGHMVGPVIFDTIKRYLTYSGYQVTWVVNITDVDDKLIVKANELGTTVEALARKMTEDYLDNLRTLGVDGIDHMPYATQYIKEMQEIIAGLIEKGYAYPLNGDVYFECTKDADYGKLSGRNLTEMLAGTRAETRDGKHNPADFALWKGSKPGEPAWDSPWGPGRPGWHIECSAMARKLLGDTIDIHGGGLDLMFPHHENELAQSESCTGKPFARYWLHNGLLRKSGAGGKIGGDHSRHGDTAASQTADMMAEKQAQEEQKLAGSKGAESVKTAVFAKFDPESVRFFLMATHYRSPVDFGDDRLAETAKSIDGFYRLIESFSRVSGKDFYSLPVPATRAESDKNWAATASANVGFEAELTALRTRFLDAMDDDFNTGAATAVLFDLRKTLNGFITEEKLEGEGRSNAAAQAALLRGVTLFKELANILGLFRKPREKKSARGADDEFVNSLMQLLISLRADARKAKQFEIADKVRKGLAELKVTLEDRPEGTIWRRES